MDTASVSELKNNLSAWLRKVRAGHTIIVTDRDVPVARIERIEAATGISAQLARLQAHGQVRPPQRRLTVAKLRQATLRSGVKVDLLGALLANRDEER